MKNILIGTTSDAKIKIVKKFFEQSGKKFNILPREVVSGIPDQPLDENTTITGACNRAKNAAEGIDKFEFSIGLEGGLIKISDLYYLICVTAIIDSKGNSFIGMSSKIPLPKEVSEQIGDGEQFGDAIRVFRKKNSDKPKIFVAHLDELIERENSFSEALRIAFLTYGFQDYFYK